MSRTRLFLGAVLCLIPQVSLAAVPATYTNENFFSSTHDAPAQLFVTPNGNFHGFTTTGKYFTQTRVVNDESVRMFRFAIEQASFYVTDQGIIEADSDLAALSIYLSNAA
jgi:hypothetical protein